MARRRTRISPAGCARKDLKSNAIVRCCFAIVRQNNTMSLVVLTNIPTPYRTAFFDALAEETARAGKRFHVLYCAKTEPGRHWPYDPEKMRHAHSLLRGFRPPLRGIHAHLNPGVLAELNRLKPDTLIIAGAWNTPTMLLACLNTYSPHPRRFFWSEGHAGAARHMGGIIAWVHESCAAPARQGACTGRQSATDRHLTQRHRCEILHPTFGGRPRRVPSRARARRRGQGACPGVRPDRP